MNVYIPTRNVTNRPRDEPWNDKIRINKEEA